MSNEIILKNNVGYGEVYLNNLIKNIDDVISKCNKIKSQYDQVQTYSIKTRFGNIYCNERSSEYSVYVTYKEGGKQLSRNAYINTSKTNKEIEKARNQINKLIAKLTELKEAMVYNKSTMKISIEDFRKEDALRAKQIEEMMAKAKNFKVLDEYKDKFKDLDEDSVGATYYVEWDKLSEVEKKAILKQVEDIEADPNSNIRVGKDENGNYIFVRTRMVSTTQLESIINEKFKDNIENRKYKIDNLNKADGYAIVFDNGDVYSMDENGNLFKDEGSILKSHSINYSGGKVGSVEMGKVKGAYYTFLGIPVGISAKVGVSEADIGPSTAEAHLFDFALGLKRESDFKDGVERVNTGLAAKISLIGGEAKLFKDENKFDKYLDLNQSISAELGVGVEGGISYKVDKDGDLSGLGLKYDLSLVGGTSGDYSINVPD